MKKMGKVPRFIFIQPSLREFFCNEYPKLRSFISGDFIQNETLVVVADSNTNYVDPKGVLYLHHSVFPTFQRHIFDFFSDYKSTDSVQKASEIFLAKIQGETYESDTSR